MLFRSVTNMHAMFANIYQLDTVDLSNFDTRNLVTMSDMFTNSSGFTTLDLSSFNTSKVTNMQGIFYKATGLTKVDVSSFDTSNVTKMYGIFFNNSKLTKINLCSWNTKKANDMGEMFLGTTSLTKVYVGPNWSTSQAAAPDMFKGSKISSVTKSNNCFVDAEDPATIEVSTSKTSNSITVVASATAESGIEKYEYQINGGQWIESTENIYTFTGLEQDTEYTIKVRVTSKVGKQTTSTEVTVTTNAIENPTFEEIEKETEKEVTIIYPEGCGDNLTCSYQKDEGEWIETTDANTKITFTESGIVIPKESDGTK